MKTKIFLSVLLSLNFCLLSSQVPQGFNYQAIARDGSGNPIANTIQVKIGFQTDTLSAQYIWEELHSSVKPNSAGLFSLVIGSGSRVSGATTFADIDWTITPVYIRVSINSGSGWKPMWANQLWSVPYSMVADKLDGVVNKLEVVGDDVSSDEALFEVKRKDGETMFAVYNHGVRVFMPLDTLSKSRKGGFAIGGFSKTKGTVQDYFVVNPDSIRAYIDTNPDKARKGGFAIGSFDKTKATNQDYLTVSSDSVRIYIDTSQVKARKGGFAIGGFSRTKGGNASFFNVSPDATENIDPSQNKILWYPLKNAFLTGRVLIEKPDSVGVNSFASGYESKAMGDWSQALGYKAIARGDYSTAIGKNALANRINSFAFGDSAQASNNESYAIGRGAIASGYRSFAFGSAGIDSAGNVTDVARALGDYSFAIGQGSRSLGNGSFVMGLADTASGDFSLALGYKSSAQGKYSVAIGNGVTARGYNAIALGYYTEAENGLAIAMGDHTKASGGGIAMGYKTLAVAEGATAMGCNTYARYRATAMGYYTQAYGGSLAMGDHTIAQGQYSTAMGSETWAFGQGSISAGYQSSAGGDYSTAIGYGTQASYLCHVFGRYNYPSGSNSNSWIETDPLFIIGNGALGNLRNAFTVYKNGNAYIQGKLGIGADSPLYQLDVLGEITSRSANAFRLRGATSSTIFRHDAADTWILLTDIGNPDGSFNNLRPFQIHSQDGSITIRTNFFLPDLAGISSGSYLRIYNNMIWYYSSSRKTKSNIEPFRDDFYKILNTSPVSFTDKVSGERNIGFIAEDFDEMGLKNLVVYKDGDPVSLSYELISLYILEIIKDHQKAIKEQQIIIESYKSENDNLKYQLQSLQEEVGQIKAMLARGGEK